jgi:transposase
MSSQLGKQVASMQTRSDTEGVDQQGEPAGALEIPDLHGLSDKQLAACDYVVSGMPQKEIAAKVQVRRETIWRWFNQDPLVRNHLRRLRLEAHQVRVDRDWIVHDKAMDVIEEALEEGDVPTAIAVVRLPRYRGALPEQAHMPQLSEPDLSNQD